MKWLILILGPNHQAKDLKALLNTEFKNLNIVIVLVNNNKMSHQGEIFNDQKQDKNEDEEELQNEQNDASDENANSKEEEVESSKEND